GFHRDPWGNVYGPLEALAYTGSDLLTLGINLLETPLSATLLIGVWLLFAAPLSRGARLFLGWALATVGANALYWHHGLYMGPRMLLESAPAWAALTALAATSLVERAPARRLFGGRFSPRSAVGGGLIFALLLGVLYMGPQRARSYGGEWVVRATAPEMDGAALVFVHGAWSSRIAMRFAGAGMRLDSVETIMRQNPTCRAHTVAARLGSSAGRGLLPSELDLEPSSAGLRAEVTIAPGNRIRVAPGEVLAGECLREARSDRNGVVDVSPLLWQGDLADGGGSGGLYVRDYGPDANTAALRRWPDRTPWVYLMPAPDADPVLVDYETGMRRLWGVAPEVGPSDPERR
ncbi:MAG TPA: hypothetical protein VMM79_17860, partial [Longimicrobiales bacterium]|nr:hypothetical protein [Longimicrobiales bacterium]